MEMQKYYLWKHKYNKSNVQKNKNLKKNIHYTDYTAKTLIKLNG